MSGWMATAESGYEVAVADGKVVCRNAAGKQLRSLPKQLREDPAVLELLEPPARRGSCRHC